jgi:hypothetical protein
MGSRVWNENLRNRPVEQNLWNLRNLWNLWNLKCQNNPP